MFTDQQEAYYSIILFSLFALLLIFIILFSAILYYNRRKKYIQEKKMMQSEFQQELLRTQIEIQEQTLKNISEEIHDNIGQVLSLAKLHLNMIPPAEEAAQAKVNDAKDLVSKAINDLRDLSRSLHGEKITEIGLEQAITQELKTLQNIGQFITSLKVDGNYYKLPDQKEMVVFRMVQEALHNALKHSKASELWVELVYHPNLFKLSVCDNGVGFDYHLQRPADTGIGLKSIRNRAALIGGKVSINSVPGNGTAIRLEIPKIIIE
jgi:two-component system, NarL family, sensor kinase